ncbi:rod-binding protein [bacterium]|nr:rod-binding protein [bacterium]
MDPVSNMTAVSHEGIQLQKQGQAFISLEREQGMYSLKKTTTDDDTVRKKARLREAAEGFEGIFIRKLLSTMRSTMSENSMFGTGPEGDIYGDIIDNALADVMAKRGILGLGDKLYDSMAARLEKKPETETNHIPKAEFLKIRR